MKFQKTSLFLFLFSLLAFSPFSIALTPAEQLKQDVQNLGAAAVTASDYKPGVIKHIVLFHYKDDMTSEQRAEVSRKFLALQTLAQRNGHPYIAQIEYGVQNNGEGADQGLQDGFVVSFKSEGDRNYYVGQPVVPDSQFYDSAHQAFKNFVGPLLNPTMGALVFDFCVTAMTSVGP